MTQMTVQVFEIGGQYMIDGGDISEFIVSGTWENGLDSAPGTSTATVTLADNCFDDRLLLIHPYLHELRISLDGDIVFEGPIRYFSGPISKGAVIVADDFSAWFDIRMIHDIFDWSTGERVDVILGYLIRSALAGTSRLHPAGSIPEKSPGPNLLDYLTVGDIAASISRQNGIFADGAYTVAEFSLGNPYNPINVQGAIPLPQPNEYLWADYMSYIVGKLAHMSWQGRSCNLWQYGTSLLRMEPADVSQFLDFPNLTRNGDLFTTRSVVHARSTSAVLDADIPPGVTNYVTGAFIQSGFYAGQQIHAGSGLQLPFAAIAHDIGGVTATSSILSMGYVDVDAEAIAGSTGGSPEILSLLAAGTEITADVFGEAGGVHPDWPGVLVERRVSQPDLIGKDSADSLAAHLVVLEAPLDTIDIDEFKAVVSQHSPWEFTAVVPGYTALVTTPLGGIVLQVTHVGGSWSSDGGGAKLELYVGLRTPTEKTFEPYAHFLGNGAPNVDGTPITVSPDELAARRRRRAGEDDMAAILVQAPSKPAAIFFPPCTWVPIDSPADATAMLGALGTYTTANVSDNQWEVWKLAAVTGTAA